MTQGRPLPMSPTRQKAKDLLGQNLPEDHIVHEHQDGAVVGHHLVGYSVDRKTTTTTSANPRSHNFFSGAFRSKVSEASNFSLMLSQIQYSSLATSKFRIWKNKVVFACPVIKWYRYGAFVQHVQKLLFCSLKNKQFCFDDCLHVDQRF